MWVSRGQGALRILQHTGQSHTTYLAQMSPTLDEKPAVHRSEMLHCTRHKSALCEQVFANPKDLYCDSSCGKR
jgi:hypothetical protein